MLVYRIALVKYAQRLEASGRAARWNPNKTEMIYTSSSRSLACLENVVRRSQLGLNQYFNVMTIQVEDSIAINTIKLNGLPHDWKEYHNMPLTQEIGYNWINGNNAAILQVPSSVVEEEVNYLLNPLHADFKLIRLIKAEPFIFDSRIKS